MAIRIVTDSTAYLSEEFILQERIKVVPLKYIFDSKEYTEGLKGSFEVFFQELARTKLFPTTSQPSAGDFVEAFSQILETHDEVIAILLSSKLSGTVASANAAKSILEDKRVTIIDSLNAASTTRFMIEEAIEMIADGKEAFEIEKRLLEMRKELSVTFFAGSLEYLKRGGRLSSSKQIIGDFLNIKPIIGLIDGELKQISKQKGTKKAEDYLISLVPENVRKIGICHILNYERALIMKEALQKKFPKAIIDIDELGPVIGSHLGPKTLGLCCY